MDGVWLQRVHGIASCGRTNATSKDFLVQTVSGSCGDAIGRHTAYVRFGVWQSVQRVARATGEAGFYELAHVLLGLTFAHSHLGARKYGRR